MKITGNQFQKINKLYQKNKAKPIQGSESIKTSDKVNLSREAKEIKRMREILEQTPVSRAEKVAHLKQAIQQGTYEINGEKIAEKIIQRHYVDRVIG